MRAKHLKILAFSLMAFACVFATVFVVGRGSMGLGLVYIANLGQLRFAPGFSRAAFGRVAPGDTSASVAARLGSPLFIEALTTQEKIRSKSMNVYDSDNWHYVSGIDLDGRAIISFDDRGIVESAYLGTCDE